MSSGSVSDESRAQVLLHSIRKIFDYLLNQLLIRGRELILGQFARIDPDRGLAFEELWIAIFVNAYEGMKSNLSMRIVVIDGAQPSHRTNGDVHLLTQLASDALLECFAIFAFAARELPVAPEMVGVLALANQHQSVSCDNSDGGFDAFHEIDEDADLCEGAGASQLRQNALPDSARQADS